MNEYGYILIPVDDGTEPIYGHPRQCPLCRLTVAPVLVHCEHLTSMRLAAVYRCPSDDCEELFLAYFVRPGDDPFWSVDSVEPTRPAPIHIPPHVADVSEDFARIYQEAHAADEYGLKEVAGGGYRKALEFLIKDYVVARHDSLRDAVSRMNLGPCIQQHVTHEPLKRMAERAAWLGNDELHYIRRWPEHDLATLKGLLTLAIKWIDLEEETRAMNEALPEGRR